ncbi:MAG: nucleotide-diphospho-sugar transferase [Candidatus Paceibacterota bacterium]|jgi:hypothetical protein
MTIPPILLIIFNRPDKVRALMNALEKVRPERIYVSADGPRTGVPSDKALCAEARAVAQNVSWPCKVITNFSENNLGVHPAVEGAITWFFDQVESGIILEDDCIPNSDFFRFSTELLEQYRDDPRVMMISGDNFQNGIKRGRANYYFSRYPNIWGWATWRRAWKHYDTSLSDLDVFEKSGKINTIRPHVDEQKHWLKFFRQLKSGKQSPWDAKWVFAIWNNDGIVAVPNTNLVKNVGFGSESTNTKETNSTLEIEASPINNFAIIRIEQQTDEDADRYIFESIFKVTLASKLAYLWRRLMS